MEKTEPTFVPEWLKNNGSLSTSSSLHSDDQGVSKSLRNNDLGRTSVSDRTTSSYFRRSYSNFGRNHRDRDWDKDYSDPLANILPSRFEKDGLRRSHSSLSAKKSESWPRKVVGEKNGHNNGKMLFERDFPSLGVEEKQADFEIGRVPSPGLTTAIQSLPVGNVAVIGGDGWTSALAEVPVMVQPTSVVATGRNMAETLAQGPPRAHTAPQLSVGTQRLEELAVKQSRQLIPVTPSMPKTSAMNSSEKSKLKVGQPSPRPVSSKADVSKVSTVGKLHVLKPSRERNGTTSKETLSPTSGGKLPNSPLAVPSAVTSAPLRTTGSSVNLEKRPSPQAQSRNDFFNLMRKKSMPTNSAPVVGPDTQTDEKSGECGPGAAMGGGGSSVILYSEEEEARFLRSLGWEETTEEGGLTEEEINSFYRDVSKYVKKRTASNFFKGTQPKCLMPVIQMGKNGDISADSKVDS
ncbi:hypothetical protein L1887_40106 [Cichorium endivia]|nr:hypothetical protein L1887_40106 [Cichorium endivia]